MTRRHIIFFGKTEQSLFDSSGRLRWTSTRDALFDGDSIAANRDGISLAAWATIESQGLLSFAPNAFTPTGGGKIPGTVAVSGKLFADRTADLAAMKTANPLCNTIIFHCGTNDIGTSRTLQQMKDDFLAYLVQAKASGFDVIFSEILRRTDGGGTAPNETKRTDFNTWCRQFAGDPMYSLLFTVNHDANLNASTTPSLFQSDNLHPNVLGARVLAGNIVNRINFGTATLDSILPANIMTNTDMAGTAGTIETGVSGVAATGWRSRNDVSGVTAVCAVGTAGGFNYQETTYSGTAATNASEAKQYRNDTTCNIVAGEFCEGGAFLDITNGAGNGPPVGLAGWQLTMTQGGTFRGDNIYTTKGPMDIEIHQFVRAIADKATGVVNGHLTLYCRFVPGVVDVKIRISRPRGAKGTG